MLKQLKRASKIVLEYVKANPGKTSSEIVVGTNTHAGAVSGSLWALWVGKYITRSRSGIVGRGPKFVYFFKTDKPRYKHRSVIVQGGKTKAPVVKDDRQLELNFGPDNTKVWSVMRDGAVVADCYDKDDATRILALLRG